MFQGVGMVGPVVALAGRARLRGWRMPVLIAVTAMLGMGTGSVPRWLDLTLAPATITFHLLVALAALWRATARLKTQLKATP